jgi:hypothetical protein
MSPISPFNGRLLWLRHGAANGEGGDWRDNFGIERIGTSLVRSYDPFGPTLLQFHQYNDNLTHSSFDQTSDGGMSFSTVGALQDFTYDGATYWTAHASVGFVEGVILEIDSSFVWQKAIRVNNAGGGSFHEADKVFATPSNGNTYFYNSPIAGSGQENIVKFTPGTVSATPIHDIAVDIPKPISLPFSVSSLTDVYDIVEITGSSVLTDGIWALVGQSSFFREILHLLRIEEDTLQWNRLESFVVNSPNDFSTFGAPGGGDSDFTCIALIDIT